MTAARSRAPARSRSPIAAARTWSTSRLARSAAPHRPPQPPGLVARLAPVLRRQGAHEQVPVVLLAGGRGLVDPDRVQDGQVIGVGEGLLPGLRRGGLLAVSV